MPVWTGEIVFLQSGRFRSYTNGILALVLVIVLILSPGASFATDDAALARQIQANQDFRYAEHLYVQQRYRAAADAFERFVFTYANDPRAAQALYQAALAHFAAGDYNATILLCQQLLDESEIAALSDQAYLLESRAHQRNKSYDQALISLNNVIVQSRNLEVVDEARYQGAWILIETLQFEEALNWLLAVSPQGAAAADIAPLMLKLKDPDLIESKNPTFAGTLAIVPGVGHLYIGRYRDALIAFALNGLTFWATWEAFDNEQPALGSLIGVVGLNLYVGNIFSAINGAQKFNRREAEQAVIGLKQEFPISLQIGLAPSGRGAQLALTLKF
jgi:tetratricopeptide (TPR) repeat protein